MIKDNISLIKITTKNIKYYTNRNYLCKIGDIISINTNTMSKMSHNIVIAICEICKSEKKLPFSKYNLNKNRQGFYSCKKCSDTKRKKTNVDIYGVEYSAQLADRKGKMKDWMSSDIFRDKSKEKNILTYGVDSYSKTDEFKNILSKITKERINELKNNNIYNCPLLFDDNREKRDRGMYDKYGASFSYNVPSIRKKIQNTNLEKFGHISPFGNTLIQESIKSIFMDKYGVDNPFKNAEIQKKIRDISIKKMEGIDISLFKNYRKSIRNLTNSIKNELFKNWDGHDYYDGEYIKDNLNLNSNNINYPTIDHKISCLFGYKNNIPPSEISRMENLCITKRKINSTKSHLTEQKFLEKIVELNKKEGINL